MLVSQTIFKDCLCTQVSTHKFLKKLKHLHYNYCPNFVKYKYIDHVSTRDSLSVRAIKYCTESPFQSLRVEILKRQELPSQPALDSGSLPYLTCVFRQGSEPSSPLPKSSLNSLCLVGCRQQVALNPVLQTAGHPPSDLRVLSAHKDSFSPLPLASPDTANCSYSLFQSSLNFPASISSSLFAYLFH